MQVVKYIFILLLSLAGCMEKTEVNEKSVSTEYAKQDGFEIIAFSKKVPISLQYKEYDENNKTLSYLIPKGGIESIKKALQNLKNSDNTSNFFIDLQVNNINKTKQDICVGYHYSKSTYRYCYSVSKNIVTPKYLEYHSLFKDKKINYKAILH